MFDLMLLTGLLVMRWDVAVFTKTWREDTAECFVLTCGHLLYGIVGRRRSCGVGFLIHTRWSCHSLTALEAGLFRFDI